LSEPLYVRSKKAANSEMTEITPAMNFGVFSRDEEANAGIADPQQSPEIRFAFQLRWFRKVGALALE
jgi:hypothetical protein